MRKLIPILNSVVCERVGEKEKVENRGILVKRKYVDLYRILDFSVEDSESFPFKVGDVVMSTSTGDEIEMNDGNSVYLFKAEHIMCSVEDI